MNQPLPKERASLSERRLQNYRGTWAWLIQRASAIFLFLLIPLKIYSGWARTIGLPFPKELLGSAGKVHTSSSIDIALLLFFLLHAFYGLRVILMDFGLIKANTFFWRTMILAMGIFGGLVWYVYVKHAE
jgi:succinate dehydrogenase/fumarate reductase cytochrome b subunit